jgi:hypothetical protein
MLRRAILAGAALAVLAACSPSRTPEEFDRRVITYVGRTEADLVAGLGVPSRSWESGGTRLLQYDLFQSSPAPAVYPSIGLGFGRFGWGGGWGSGVGVGTGVGLGFGAPAQVQGCALVFEVRDGLVQGFQRNGPGCVA